MSDKIREAFNRINAKIIEGGIASAFSIFKEGYEAGVALAQQPAAAVPDGWKLVPVRATREQANAVCMHPDLARTLYRNMVEAAPAAPAPAAQEPVAWLRDDGDGDLEFSANGHGFPVYTAQPSAEQPAQPTDEHGASDYPPCDYCGAEVDYMPWHGSGPINGVESRHIHACDHCRNLLPSAEQPDTVAVPRELLRELADIADSMQCFDARDDAMDLLDKELEA